MYKFLLAFAVCFAISKIVQLVCDVYHLILTTKLILWANDQYKPVLEFDEKVNFKIKQKKYMQLIAFSLFSV